MYVPGSTVRQQYQYNLSCHTVGGPEGKYRAPERRMAVALWLNYTIACLILHSSTV